MTAKSKTASKSSTAKRETADQSQGEARDITAPKTASSGASASTGASSGSPSAGVVGKGENPVSNPAPGSGPSEELAQITTETEHVPLRQQDKYQPTYELANQPGQPEEFLLLDGRRTVAVLRPKLKGTPKLELGATFAFELEVVAVP